MSLKIFVSYRRADTAAEALSVGQFLEREFGGGSVFMDIDIHAGENFPRVLDQRLAQSKVVLAVIGPNWLEAKDGEGRRRLDDAKDWVRLEIAQALARGVTVIPLCVNNAALPKRAELPEDLRGLVDHQAAFVTTSRFRNDMAGLVRDIRAIPDPFRGRRIGLIAAGVIVTLLILGSVWKRFTATHPTTSPPVPTVTQSASTSTQAELVPPKTQVQPGNERANHAGEKTAADATTDGTREGKNKSDDVLKQAEVGKLSGSISFHSDPGDYIGQGKDWTVGNADGIFTGEVKGKTVSIMYHGDDLWDFTFVAPEGQRLSSGPYSGATRAPFNSPVKPGLSVSGAGRGCNTLTGKFNIRQIEYSNSGTKLKRFLADFEQHCEGQGPALSGTIDLTATE